MIARIITITTTAIIMFLFLLGPSNIAMALSLLPGILCQLTNKTGHSQNQNGPRTSCRQIWTGGVLNPTVFVLPSPALAKLSFGQSRRGVGQFQIRGTFQESQADDMSGADDSHFVRRQNPLAGPAHHQQHESLPRQVEGRLLAAVAVLSRHSAEPRPPQSLNIPQHEGRVRRAGRMKAFGERPRRCGTL